ncbi:unnamed protein product [Ectocarpus sp. 12 AP-2014]
MLLEVTHTQGSVGSAALYPLSASQSFERLPTVLLKDATSLGYTTNTTVVEDFVPPAASGDSIRLKKRSAECLLCPYYNHGCGHNAQESIKNTNRRPGCYPTCHVAPLVRQRYYCSRTKAVLRTHTQRPVILRSTEISKGANKRILPSLTRAASFKHDAPGPGHPYIVLERGRGSLDKNKKKNTTASPPIPTIQLGDRDCRRSVKKKSKT